jgi:hypothetical protein
MSLEAEPFAAFLLELRAWLLSCALLALRLLCMFLARAWAFLASSRTRRLLFTAALTLALLAGARLLPVLYGHYALAHEARTASEQSVAMGTDRVVRNLQRAAFNLGFHEAALQPGVFTLEFVYEDGLQRCAVSYDFTHVVDFYGFKRVPLRIRHQVVRRTLDRLPSMAEDEG